MDEADVPLMTRVACRDVAAFEAIYRRHVDFVLTYGTKRCRDAHAVTEMVASVFVSVWERAETFDPTRGEFRAWLSGIASNCVIDLRRADERQVRLRERLRSHHVPDVDEEELLDDRIDAARRADDVEAAIAALPASQREVFRLVVFDGLTCVEVADALDMTPTAVRMRMSRARQAIRERLSRCEGDRSPPSGAPVVQAEAT